MSKFKFTGAEMDLVMDVIGNYIHNGLQTSQLFDRIESLLSEREEYETAQLRADNERLRAEVEDLKYVLEKSKTAWTVSHNTAVKRRKIIAEIQDERETMIQAFKDIREQFEGRSWVLEGRGSYPYNDDRYKEEMRYIFDAFRQIEKEMWRQITSKSHEYKKSIEQPLRYELSAANQRIAELEELLKSDSVYGLLRFAYKSPESAQVYDVADNKYYDLYEISKKLRDNKTK